MQVNVNFHETEQLAEPETEKIIVLSFSFRFSRIQKNSVWF